MTRILRAIVVVLLPGLSACELLTLPSAEIRAWGEPGAIVISNPGERPIYYFAIEQGTAALTLWGPCSDPARCDGVAPGARVELALESVPGYTREAETVLVYWWHLVPADGGGFRPDEIRVAEVRL